MQCRQCVEPGGDLLEQAQRRVDREWAVFGDVPGERLPIEQFHDEEWRFRRFVEPRIEHFDDVAAVDARGDLGFELEFFAGVPDAHDVRKQELQGDAAFGGRVLRFEDGPHAAFGDAAPNAVARSEDLSRLEQKRSPKRSNESE